MPSGQNKEARKNMSDNNALRNRLRELIVSSLNLEGLEPASIADDEPLFNEGLGLDSVDALELVVALEKEFRIRIESEQASRDAFGSLRSLADFIEAKTSPEAPGSD